MNIKQIYKKHSLFLHAAIVLAISYIIVSCFVSSTKSLSFFFVIDEAGDVPMSNMYMNINAKKGYATSDTTITLVSVDFCEDRLEIARLIEQIDSLHPKVIGLDVFFKNREEAKSGTVLENVIFKCKNLVVANSLDAEQSQNNDRYNICNRSFFVGIESHNFIEGFINLDGEDNSLVQTFTPKLFFQKENALDTLYCFATQVVKFCDESAFQKLFQRKGNSEIINFQPLRFYELEKHEIEDNKELITGKIVLIGTLSKDFKNTPINSRMCGVEVHAHIISTIIKEKYIDRLDNIWTKMINILFCYLFALFCWFATTKIKHGITVLIKLAQVLILVLAFFTGYYLFNRFNIDITYTKTIIVMGIVILIVDIYHVAVTFGHKWIVKYNNKNSRNEKVS